MFFDCCNQHVGRNFDAKVNHLVAVVAQNYLHQVLANVMDIAFHGGQDNLALNGRACLLHVWFKVRYRKLHGLSRLQNLGHDQFVGVELAANFGHAFHQRSVDDLKRGPPGEGFVQVFGQPLFGAFNDAESQALIQRQAFAFF